MSLTRWEPFPEMDEIFKGFGPLFGRLPVARTGEGLEEFMPLADIVERDKEYLIKLEAAVQAAQHAQAISSPEGQVDDGEQGPESRCALGERALA